MIRIRLTGSRDDVDLLLTTLHGIDGIEHVEEVDEPMDAMRDDSSSNALVDDSEGSLYRIEVQVPDTLRDEAVHAVAETQAMQRGYALEFVEEF
jgi:hypothetical protein